MCVFLAGFVFGAYALLARFVRGQPPYLQIAEELRRKIINGELAPGDHLPSGREIAREWNCAYATAAKVLATLRKEGLADSYSGQATVVSARKRHRHLGDRYRDARYSHRIHSAYERSEIRESRIVEAPDLVAIALGLQPKAWVIRRHRVLYEGDTPSALATSWFSGVLRNYWLNGEPMPSALIETDSIPEGTGPYVERITGRTMTTAQDRLAAPDECEQVQLDPPAAILEVHHTVLDENDQPMTFEVNIVPADRWATYDYPVAAAD
jgi:DNA-binding GntR family transcriptional regulator